MSNNVKICTITTVTITMNAFMLDISKHLKNSGFHVSLLCSMDEKFVKENSKNYKCHNVLMTRDMNALTALCATIRMYKIFKKEKYAIIQYTSPNAALYASIAGLFARVPVRVYCQWGLRYEGLNGAKQIIAKFLERFTCMCSTVVEPDSFATLEKCIANKMYSNKKAHVVLNGSATGVDMEIYNLSNKLKWRKITRTKYHIDDKSTVFGFVGRICKDKGINELLEAFKRIESSNCYDVKLLIVGPEDQLDGIDTTQYKWAQNNENIIFVGKVNNPWEYFACFDIFVTPSYREGFGTTVIEAQAMGIPVIASDIDGPREGLINGTTGILVKKENSDDLCRAMEELLVDETKRNLMSERGIEYVSKKFSRNDLMNEIYLDRIRLLKKDV